MNEVLAYWYTPGETSAQLTLVTSVLDIIQGMPVIQKQDPDTNSKVQQDATDICAVRSTCIQD